MTDNTASRRPVSDSAALFLERLSSATYDAADLFGGPLSCYDYFAAINAAAEGRPFRPLRPDELGAWYSLLERAFCLILDEYGDDVGSYSGTVETLAGVLKYPELLDLFFGV